MNPPHYGCHKYTNFNALVLVYLVPPSWKTRAVPSGPNRACYGITLPGTSLSNLPYSVRITSLNYKVCPEMFTSFGDIWEQLYQIKILFRKELRAD